jgi:hypothetical protein
MRLVIFFLLFLAAAEASEPASLSFENLADTPSHQEVIVRGFLYQTKEGGWLLAAVPNLKSCCFAARHCVERQIFVEGDMGQPHPGRVYSVQGTFVVEPVKDKDNQLLQLYHLKNASLMR